MGYNKEDYIRIKAEFSQKYASARSRAQQRQTELHAAIPEVRRIDALLAGTGMEIMAAVTSGGNAEEQIAKIRERNERLLAERGELLQKAGYPEDYSDVQYECQMCGDTGYVDTKMCTCMKRALVLAGYESSGLGRLIATQSFDNFSVEYYDDKQSAAQTVKFLRSFSESFCGDTYMNFILMGGTGLGKTHLSTAVSKNIIDRGFNVLYTTAVGMISDYEVKRFGNGINASGNDTSRYTECDLLVIDDMGTEVTNQFTVSCLYDVINTRMNAKRSTIINTNLTPKELEARYGERIYSRILGEFHPVFLKGTDIRKQKKGIKH